MENIMRFESLWESAGVAQSSRSSIQEIRLKILKVQLEQHKDDGGRLATIEGIFDARHQQDHSLISLDITKETMRAVKWLLERAEHSPHRILRELHSKGKTTCEEPILFVQAMISLWRKSATPFLTRDINFGATRGPESLKNGNIGLCQCLTAENWTPPNDARLQAATLIANSATSVVFAAYLIGHKYEGESWKAAVQDYHASDCVRSFLKCAWQVARRGGELHPGAEFGAFADEVKLSVDGKRLLVKIGRGKWTKPAYWHPCKRVPGSAWNKFLKNKIHPIFQGSYDMASEPSERIMHRMPSTAIKLAEVFEDYYADIRARMDQVCLRGLP
uniref:Mating type protein n=1 Tax=Hapsidospora chrysogena TaxID=5044 RepID=B5WYM3_HAPCH|nr:mating type protein [Hapsidospora chrysogena]